MEQAKKCGNRYPWEEWFRKKQFTLVRGRDFPEEVMSYSMAQTVRNVAGRPRWRLRVKIEIVDEEKIECQVVGRLGRRANPNYPS